MNCIVLYACHFEVNLYSAPIRLRLIMALYVKVL